MRPIARRTLRPRRRGVALLTAMVTVTLVATIAAGATWQLARQVDVERAERTRQQMDWLLSGAIDWARLILHEDALSSQIDALSEPWALPLRESRISTLMSSEGSEADDPALAAYLSGQITDEQSKLNLVNLIDGSSISPVTAAQFQRLFQVLGVPQDELTRLEAGLQQAVASGSQGALLPTRLAQLEGWGLAPPTIAALEPYVALLPERTPVNINTAAPAVLVAAVAGLSMSDAERLVADRTLRPYRDLGVAGQDLGRSAGVLNTADHAVGSRYFKITARMDYDGSSIREAVWVRRDGSQVTILARERLALGGGHRPDAGRS